MLISPPPSQLKVVIQKLFPLFIVLGAIAIFIILSKTKPPTEKKEATAYLPVVEVMAIQASKVTFQVSSYGIVKPKHQTQIVSEVQGRITRLSEKFVAGGRVNKNEILAKIEAADYEAIYIQAQANLAQAQARFAQEKAESNVALKDWQNITDQEPTELGLRKPQLRQEKANVKYAKAALAKAKRDLERTAIRAPFEGLIKIRQIDLGEYLVIGKIIGQLLDTRTAEVRLPIPDEELEFIDKINSKSNPIKVAIYTKLMGNKIEWQGIITRSEGVIDEKNRMIYLVAEVDDPYLRTKNNIHPQELKFGTFVNAEITGITLEKVFKIPRFLIKDSQVLLVKNNQIYQRKINVIRSDIQFAYVTSGLQNNDVLSITPLENIIPGMKVKVINADTTLKELISTRVPTPQEKINRIPGGQLSPPASSKAQGEN
jgi:membrane fusion protein, multidrug efflux system